MIIDVVFKLLNFFVLAGLSYYVIQRYMVPAVVKMIAEYDVFINKLKDDAQAIQVDCQLITKKSNSQELQFQAMQVRFLEWQQKCQSQKNIRMVNQQHIEKKIQSRFDVRSHVVMNELAIKEQLPYILDRVTQKLQEKYSSTESQDKYIKELIHAMKEQS